jgi:aspartate aminotransferase
MISDEAYREMFYTGGKASSIWGIEEREVPGIQGRRISIESASKIWNGCGLRIGAIVTDRKDFHEKAVAENTSNLCSSSIGQYLFAALGQETHASLQSWFAEQRKYYSHMAKKLTRELKKKLPGLIVSDPDAALYTVVDVRDICKKGFDATEFVMHCARTGSVELDGVKTTLLVAPLEGFYSSHPNPGKTQMRIAYVEPPEVMELVPHLFAELYRSSS